MQYDVVFEGGGAKGMVFVGALQELNERGHTFGRLLGTSAGAIAATFTAAGYTVEEMRNALSEKDENGPIFQTFMGKPAPFTPEEIENSATKKVLEQIDIPGVPGFAETRFDRLVLSLMSQDLFLNLFSLVERGGWYSADAFLEWAKRKLDEGEFQGRPRQFSHMTFAQFFEATGQHLSLIAADTTANHMLVLNHTTSPDCPVVWGMRMSMSLPLVWQEVVWQKEWGAYLKRELTNHRIVDGGLLSNFPVELFVSQDSFVLSLMGHKTSDGVLGLLIDESLDVEGAEPPVEPEPRVDVATLPLTSRLRGLLDTATQAHDKMVIEAFEQYVCRLPARGFSTTEFNMTDERREALIAAGKEAMAGYFRAQEREGAKEVDVFEAHQAKRHANNIALSILTP